MVREPLLPQVRGAPSVKRSKSKGGEGVEILLEHRDLRGFDANGNWCLTLFHLRGRALPVLPLLVYYIYCIAVVSVIMLWFRPIFVECEGSNCFLDSLTVPISIVGGALFFLLVFRTNSSYARWWEGRKVWGQMLTTCRNLARLSAVCLKERELSKEIIRWTMAFPITVKTHLRGEKDLSTLSDVLTQTDMVDITSSYNMPMHVLLRLSALLRVVVVRKLLPDAQIYSIDGNLNDFMAQFAAVERIKKTPMPFAYVAHLRTFMVLWLMSLPFALVHDLEWMIIVVCVIIGYAIMGIEAIGVEIENPFGRDFNDLPLDSIVSDCKDNLMQIMDYISAAKEGLQPSSSGSIADEGVDGGG